MTPAFEIDIPGKAFSWNWLYSQHHWTQRRDVITERKALAGWLIKAAGPVEPLPGEGYICDVTAVYRNTKTIPDADNICVKAEIDAIVNAGLLPDDRHRWIREYRARVEIDPQADGPHVIIKLLGGTA